MHKLLAAIAISCGLVLVAAPAGADKEDDQRIADEAGLTPADLPDGWDSEPSDDFGTKTNLDECRRIDRVNQAALDVAYEETPLFTDGDDPSGETRIEGAVLVFPTAKGAKRYVAAYASEAGRDCVQAVGESAVDDLPSNEVGTSDLQLSAGDDAVGYRLDLEGTSDAGVTDTAVLDLIVIRQSRAVMTLAGQGPDAPPQLDNLINTVLDRLGQEL